MSDWRRELVRLKTDRERRRFFERHPSHRNRQTLDALNQELLAALRQDRTRAERLALAIVWLADDLDDDYARGLGAKALGNIRYLEGSYETALSHYLEAARRFREQGAAVDAAITLSSSIHTQILLGRYVQAFAAAREARQIFESHDERLLLARLDSNEAQILLRQGHLGSAVERFERVLAVFRNEGEPQDLAAALYNIAVCRIGLHQFPQALATYQELSAHCAEHAMQLVAAQADYNIAYLHFLRGEYIIALELYRRTRELLEEAGDPYHSSLCDLDQAEIYLELNLTEDGERLAERAGREFERLGNRFETAKAVTFQAIATSQKGGIDPALALFDRARQQFEREQNPVWLAVVELYKSLVLHRAKRSQEARPLAAKAAELFHRYRQVGKAALCQLLLARLDLDQGQLTSARDRCRAALQQLEATDVPASTFQAHLILGRAQESLGESREALTHYREAHRTLEDLRCHLRGEELKIAFLEDKYEVYQHLVWLTLEDLPSADDQQRAMLYIEQAKSRCLADLVAFNSDALPTTTGDRALAEQLQQQRDELNWTYRRLDLHELEIAEREAHSDPAESSPPQRWSSARDESAEQREELRELCHDQEQLLLETFAELRSRDVELSSLQAAGCLDLETLHAALPPGALLIELFEARGRLFVALLSQDELEVRKLGGIQEIVKVWNYLQFNLSKHQLTPDYIEIFGEAFYQAALAHLRELYDLLLAPVEDRLTAERVIFVPHGILHYVPFHALWDGSQFVIDRFPVSYAPSASVFAMCCSKPANTGQTALVMGVPDELTPHIRGEVEAVAAAVTGARLLLGSDATEARLRRLGPDSRWIHIATHGLFRQDNPMFSAIQLGTSRLTLFDLYQLELAADLVVLSGCATGLNVVKNGDELIGLTRGLLYAGASAALVSLWDVNDASTAELMSALYRHLEIQPDRSEAIRQAMLELRESFPHPFYWAPFVLIGKPA